MRTMRHLLALAVCFGTACAPAHVVSAPAPLIGALVRSDVWAPAPLPPQAPGHAPATQPLVNAAPVGIGVRIPVGLASP